MLKFLLELFVMYLLYKLIVELIIPVYRATRIMNQRVQDMKREAHSEAGPNTPTPNKPPKAGEYIDFEEVK